MTSVAMAASSAAAASQSTVFITMVDDGEGSGFASTSEDGGSLSGAVFGAVVSLVSRGNPGFRVDLAGSASGQSFFRSVRYIGATTALLNTADATYNSGNNTWTWATDPVASSYTLQFFR